MWDAGVHPAQEEGWAEPDVGGTQWDDYDVLAALGLLHSGLPANPTFSGNWEVMVRLKTFLGLCGNLIPELETWPDPALPVRGCADIARNANWLDRLSEKDRVWLHEQSIYECINTWDKLGDGLRAAFPQPYGIIELVVVSPEANEHFNTGNSAR